jgi:hypothetical protein
VTKKGNYRSEKSNANRLSPWLAASGSGKSSVVRSGLVPRLRSERRTAWETVILVPTAEPMKALVPLLEPTMSEVDRLRESAKLGGSLKAGRSSSEQTA